MAFLAIMLKRLVFGMVLTGIIVTLLLTLPFRWFPPPTSAFILQAKTGGLGNASPCTRITREWVEWQRIAPVVPLAVIAAEDQLFPSHWGFDLNAIATALREHRLGGRMRGASTITQQLAKNLYLWPGQTWQRKGIEAWFALVLEATWPKRRILEVYLNTVQFGDCTFGIEAASQQFFRKPASGLSHREAALLASALPNPMKYSVVRPSSYMHARTEWIMQQMRLLGGKAYLSSL